MDLFNLKTKVNANGADDDSADIRIKSQIVINSISDGIVFINRDGLIELFNPAAAALTGWAASDATQLSYRSIFTFVNSESHNIEESENPIAQALRSAQFVANDNINLLTKSKLRVPIDIKVNPIIESSSSNAACSGVVVVFRDISKEQAEQNAQTDFISTASHEMRTPVAIIEGYLGMILNPETSTIDARARSYAEKAHDSVRRLGKLFQDLLDVTKVDDRRMHGDPTLLDVNALIQRISEDFTDAARSKGLYLEVTKDGDVDSSKMARNLSPMPIVFADLDQLNEVLCNLIENALKYTKVGGIKIKSAIKGSRVRIEISDTGIGIPSEDIPHLFQKFYRVDNSQTREIGGTGLGLYLVKRLVEGMGGVIGVDSVFGHGTTVWLELDNLTRSQAIQKAREIKAKQLQHNSTS